MKIKFITLLLTMSLFGCVIHSGPEKNLDFYHISQLAEIEGTYKNAGDPDGYLSSIIWGDTLQSNSKIIHKDIDFIAVTTSNNQLLVKAISDDCIVYERQYYIGRDFEIEDGKITISTDTHLLTRGGDDVLFGPSYEKITVGLDTDKHGKSQNSGYAAGLIFMLIPVIISGDSDIRFDRVNINPNEFEVCKR